MSTMVAVKPLHRSAKIGLGAKDVVPNKVTWVNVENKRVSRDLARHSTFGQTFAVNPPRFQLDTAQVDLGGSVTPRTGSLVLDVAAANYTSSTDGVTKGALAATTQTAVPSATLPLLAAIGIDTSTFATGSATILSATGLAAVTENRALNFPFSLATAQVPAVDSTANRTWLALVWVPPSLTTITSVAGTGVVTTASAHGYVVGDQVWFSAITGGAGIVVNTLYTVTSVPSTTTFVTTATHTTNLTAGTVQRQILAADVIDIRP